MTTQAAHAGNTGRHDPPSIWRPSTWRFNSLPVAARLVVTAVHLVAALVIVTSPMPDWHRQDQWVITILLAGGAIVYGELNRQTEQANQAVMTNRHGLGQTVFVSTCTTWSIAAALLLPLPMAALVVLASYTTSYLRVMRLRKGTAPFRSAYTAATVVLACWSTQLVARLYGLNLYSGDLELTDIGALVLAVIAFTSTNFILVTAAKEIANRTASAAAEPAPPKAPEPHTSNDPARRSSKWAETAFEVTMLILGALLALLLGSGRGWIAVLLVPPMVMLYRGNSVREITHDAAADDRTGLLNLAAWHRAAAAEVDHAVASRQTAALLLADIDGLRTINARRGMEAGDDALEAIAAIVRAVGRPDDVLGHLGGGQFAIMAAAVDSRYLAHLAHTLKAKLAATAGLSAPESDATTTTPAALPSVSIGGAMCPWDGVNVRDLLTTADRALRFAKQHGPGTIRLSTTPDARTA